MSELHMAPMAGHNRGKTSREDVDRRRAEMFRLGSAVVQYIARRQDNSPSEPSNAEGKVHTRRLA